VKETSTSRIAPWKKRAELAFQRYSALLGGLFEGVKFGWYTSLFCGLTVVDDPFQSEGDGFVSIAVQGQQRYRLNDPDISWLAANL
jgi:hypothetical protein